MVVEFEQLVKKTDRGLFLFGTVPPRKTVPFAKVEECARKLVSDVAQLGVDAIVVYEVQDETGRVLGKERPYPFAPSNEPLEFAVLLKKYLQERNLLIECVIYRALPYHSREEFLQFLDDAARSNCNTIALVGGTPSADVLSIDEAAKIARERTESFCIGGVTLAERHRDRGDEHKRVAAKVDQGLSFFTSQVVYNADNAISFLQDYSRLCKAENRKPARIIFTFAPFGLEETAQFLRWLGVELPDGTYKRVMSKENSQERVNEAVNICCENLKRILDAVLRYGLDVPIGVTAECVSKYKCENLATLELFSLLKLELEDFYIQKRRERVIVRSSG